MTKKELIKLLEDVPDDSLILVHSHSNGYNNCYKVEQVKVKENKANHPIVGVINGNWQGHYSQTSEANQVLDAWVIR